MVVADVRITFLNKNDRFNPRPPALPVYPPEAAANGVQDVVIVEFTIGPDGKASDTRVVRSVPALDDAAVAAVERWEFDAVHGGVTAHDSQTVAMQFLLR